MNISPGKVWVGVVAKGGATLFIIGAETLQGTIARLDQINDLSTYWYCKALGFRIGPGLGASGGLSLIIVINTQLFGDLHGLDLGGFGLTFAFTDKFGKVPMSIEEFEVLKAFGKSAQWSSKKNPGNTVTNFVNNILNGVTSNGQPTGFVIDIPFAGAGLELSAVWTFHYKLEMGNMTVHG
jgi:hypothetical protein